MNFKEEPQFLVNDFLAKSQKELERVMREINREPPAYYNEAKFLREFTNNLLRAYVNQRNRENTEKREKIRAELEKRKNEILKEITNETRLKPIVKKELNPKPILTQAQVEEMASPPSQKELEEVFGGTAEKITDSTGINIIEDEIEAPAPQLLRLEKMDLIKSRLTGAVMVSRTFDGEEYKIEKPELSDNEKVLIKALEKIASVKKLGSNSYVKGLIKKTAGENNIEIDKETEDRIRYYLIRDLVKLGPLSGLVEDPNVNEIKAVLGEKITVTYDGHPGIPTNIIIEEREAFNQIVKNLAEQARAKDKTRINQVVPAIGFVEANLDTDDEKGKIHINQQ